MVRIFFIITSFIGFINAQEISSSVSTKNISITESIIFTIKISNIDENPSVDVSKIEDAFSIISYNPLHASDFFKKVFLNIKKV